MTPVRKDHLSNLSQSISHNLNALAKHKYSEEARLKKNFKELRQLLDVREKWLIDQLDQLTSSQICILKAQKETVDEEASMCKDDKNDNKYCLPLYKFSDDQMPSFNGDYERIRDYLLAFGEITSQDANGRNVESKSALDAIESEKWLRKSDWETVSDVVPEPEKKEDWDVWLMSSQKSLKVQDSISELVRAWTLREKPITSQNNAETKSVLTGECESIVSEAPAKTSVGALETWTVAGSQCNNNAASDYNQWIKREACRLSCPENKSMWLKTTNSTTYQHSSGYEAVAAAPLGTTQANVVLPTVEIEDLSQLKCVASEDNSMNFPSLLSPCNPYMASSADYEIRKWLANPSGKRVPTYSESMTSRCSSVSTFCEANELCCNFDECVADEPRCVSRYNEWLMSTTRRPNKPKPRLEVEDLSLWLKRPVVEEQDNMYVEEIEQPKRSFKTGSVSSHDSFDWFENGVRSNLDYWLAKN